MWVLHAIVLICTGVPKKPVWRDHPFSKRQAALQLWPGTASLIQRDCTTLLQARLRGVVSDPWGGGRRGGTRLPPPSVAAIASVGKSPVCELLVNPVDKETQPVGGREGDEWMTINVNAQDQLQKKAWVLVFIFIFSRSKRNSRVCRIHSPWSHRRPSGVEQSIMPLCCTVKVELQKYHICKIHENKDNKIIKIYGVVMSWCLFVCICALIIGIASKNVHISKLLSDC